MNTLVADIQFAEASGEFTSRAPLLRYVAGLTYGTDAKRADFIAACVECGYRESTAAVCWAAGRKFMAELESETI